MALFYSHKTSLYFDEIVIDCVIFRLNCHFNAYRYVRIITANTLNKFIIIITIIQNDFIDNLTQYQIFTNHYTNVVPNISII